MMTEKKYGVLPIFGILTATIIWGFSFVVVKDGLALIPPLFMTSIRFTLSAIFLALVFVKKLKYIKKKTLLCGAVLGFFLYAATALQTVALQTTDAGVCAFLTTAYVVWAPFMAWGIFKKRPNKQCLLAMALALIGIGLLSLTRGLGLGFGELLTLICGVGYGLHIVFSDKFTEEQDPILLAVLQMIFGAVFAWIMQPFAGESLPIASLITESGFWIAILYTGILSTGVCFLFQCMSQKHLSVVTTSILLATESIFATIFSVIFLQEALGAKKLTGFVLLFAAVIISQVTFTRKIKK